MDPFVIVSFGKKTFRTKVIRHNLNPVFNERLIFQVMKSEKQYTVYFNIYDRDKLSSNDFVAESVLPISELIASGPTPDPETGLYQMPEPWKEPEAYRPKAKRQDSKSRFGILSRSSSATNLKKASGNGGNGRGGLSTPGASTSTLELQRSLSSTSLSDTQGTVLSKKPSNTSTGSTTPPNPSASLSTEDKDLKTYVIPLKMRHGSRYEEKHTPELVVKAKYVPYTALRQQLWRCLLSEYDVDDSGRLTRVELVTMLDSLGSTLKEETINSFFARFKPGSTTSEPAKEAEEITVDQAVICLEDQLARQGKPHTPPVETVGSAEASPISLPAVEKTPSNPSDLTLSALETDNGSNGDSDEVERVIVITECPLCHQPRMNKRSEVDIVTHLATCASQDWRQVDHFVMGGFVTSSQAHRKWYTKVCPTSSKVDDRLSRKSRMVGTNWGPIPPIFLSRIV
jgi:phosphatidylserine decarboxylase